jgi:TOMM system kinase/cyclase fusion protein
VLALVLDALACAHARAVVHRDLKPANIMVHASGVRRHAMVLDFGLGGFVEATRARSSRITRSGELVGTPIYAAPEQLWGDPSTARSDLYSWGLVLIECLTGRAAIEGRTVESVLHMQLGPDPVPVPEGIARSPLGVAVRRVTEKDPAQRDVAIAELLETLDDVAAGRITTGEEPGVGEGRGSSAPAVGRSERREQRQITRMSCRFRVVPVEGAAPDPEELERILELHFAACREIVERGGGRLSGVVGSRILFAFGIPTAREDAARRAVRSALDAVEELQRNPTREVERSGIRVELYVGIHTGVEIVSASGEGGPATTADVASALDACAEAGEVLLSERSAELLRGDPQVVRTSLSAVAGMELRESVFRACGPGEPGSERLESVFVGRERELAELERTWRQADAGSPRLLWVRGEAGIGKTRLVREFRRRVAEAPWLECRCSPDRSETPLSPLAEALAPALGDLPQRLRELEIEAQPALPLLSALLSRPLPDGFRQPELGPERRKELTFQCLLEVLFRYAAQRGLLLVVEDLHWSDPTTREFLERLAEEVRGRPAVDDEPLRLCVLLTSRPGFSSWTDRLELPVLQLAGLEPPEARRLIVSLAQAQRDLGAELVDAALRRAEGIPLFLEEVTRMLCRGDGGGRTSSSIPGNLQDLLAARLDVLDAPVKDTAQRAALLGREFPLELLEAMSPSPGELDAHIQTLRGEGLILHQRRAPGRFAFKHALLRDVAYASLPPSRRRHEHEVIARLLEDRFPGEAASRPETLAHHFEQAGCAQEALQYWNAAGRLARSRWANHEAVHHWRRALALLPGLPDDDLRRKSELQIQRRLGNTLMTTEGYASQGVERCFQRARELCVELGDEGNLFRALNGLWGVHLTRADSRTRELAREIAAMGMPQDGGGGDRVRELAALFAIGVTAFYAGKQAEALPVLERALAVRDDMDAEELARSAATSGAVTGVPCYVAWCRLLSGRPDAAVDALEAWIASTREGGSPYALAEALNHAIALWHDLDEAKRVREIAEEVIALSRMHGFTQWAAVAESAHGWTRVLGGEEEAGLRQIEAGMDRYRRTGAGNPLAYRTAYAVEALLAAGRIEAGIARVERCLEEYRHQHDRFWDVELIRRKGELLAAAGREAAAKECFAQALRSSRRQGAHWLALRAARSALEHAAGGREVVERREELRGALEKIEGGEGTRDVRAARAWLSRTG